MAKQQRTPMTVRLKSFFNPEEGQYGMSQGSYIITDKGEFNCYNDGPQWFTMADKDNDIQVMGAWKQSKKGWYLVCNYGQEETAGPQGPTPQQNATGATPGSSTGSPEPTGPTGPAAQPRNDDKKVRGMCRFGFYQALLQSGATAAQLAGNMEELLAIEKLVDMSMLGIESAQKKAAIANAMPNEGQPVSDDDIPY